MARRRRFACEGIESYANYPSTMLRMVPLPIFRWGGKSSSQPGAFDDSLELGQAGVEIMHPGGVEEREVEAPIDDRSDRPALSFDLVAAEMVVIELEAAMAEEVAGLQAGHLEPGR